MFGWMDEKPGSKTVKCRPRTLGSKKVKRKKIKKRTLEILDLVANKTFE